MQSIATTSLNSSSYLYDKTGNLTNDAAENLTVQWNAAGKVKSFFKGAQEYRLSYSPMGQRQTKARIQSGILGIYDVYIHDASGNVMAVYSADITKDELKLKERHIYGSSRLGVYNKEIAIYAPPTGISFTRGQKTYELSNHLGNVNTVISDRKKQTAVAGSYLADIKSYVDYYPFGVQMPGRTWQQDEYRFGFNGQEKDDEIYGEGNSTTAEFWQYDARLGRRWNVDPEALRYSMKSPYSGYSNNPIIFIDPAGNTDFYYKGNWIGTDGKKDNLIAIVRDRKVKKEITSYTKRGSDFLAGILDNGDIQAGFFVIHYDILSEANKNLNKALDPAGHFKEFSSSLVEIGSGYHVTSRQEGQVIDLLRQDRATTQIGKGDVSIHSHLIGTVMDNRRPVGMSAEASTYEQARDESDEVTFRDYKMNLIVGKEGVPEAYQIGDGPINISERKNIINVYGSNLSNGKIGTIYQNEIGNILSERKGKLYNRYQSKKKNE